MDRDPHGNRMRCALSLRLLGLVGVLAFVASAFTEVPNILAALNNPRPRLDHADAIVVLGAGIYPDGVLTSASLRRAVNGIVLYRRGLARLLVFTGPSWNGRDAESAVRAELARQLGVSPEVILTEQEARTTREEAVRLRTRLGSRGIRRILLVTDSQHMLRAQGLFERAGFEVLPAPADDFSTAAAEPEERLRLMRRIAQEFVARFYYRLAGYL